MQISKLFLVVCVATAGLIPLTLRGAPTEAQPAGQSNSGDIPKGATLLMSPADVEAGTAKNPAPATTKTSATAAAQDEKAAAKSQKALQQAPPVIEPGATPQPAKAKKAAKPAASPPASNKAATTSASKPAPAKAKPATAKASGKTNATQAKVVKPSTGFSRPEAPPSPLSADKQQRLADLLQQYKAEKLSPEDYHAARAKILAEP
jgi:hypothetical protein